MKSISFSLCTFFLLASGSRRDLQSTPWTLDVEQLSGSCEEADLMFHNLWNDASNLCSATINRMTPPAICKQQNSQPCPPGVEADCPDADPFNKVCVVNYETCARSLNEQFWEILLTLAGPIGGLSDLGWYAMKGATAGVYAGLFGLDLDAQINYGEAVKEAKLSFRKLFHDYPDMLMELVEHSFAQPEQRESMSEGWSRVSQHTQQTILAHACRWEADKALRYVDFDLLMEDMKSKSAFYDLWLNDQGSCFSAFSGDDNHEIDNQVQDCVNKASSLIGLFDPTGISALVGQATKLDWCPDIHDDNDPHYSPRAALSEDHPWHSVKEKLAETLRVGAVTNTPYVENSRGDGESMAHQLRRKLLSQACPTEYKFSKGVCRPVSIGQHSTWGQTLVHYHDTRPQLIFVDEGSVSNDQCCDKEGMTTIHTESDCQKAAQELRPWGSYIGTVNDDSIPYGCYADIRTEDVGFNTNPSNGNLLGFYEPICGAGDNLYEVPDFNIIRVAEGYVMGSLGEACADEDRIVRAEDCAYAIEQMTISNPPVQNLVASTGKMGGCSLQVDESLGFYNDKHPIETNIPDNDPAFDLITCRMTIDNVITHVRYGGVDVDVSGDKTNWKSVNTFTFKASPGAELEIGGYEKYSCHGCQCSGLIIECDNGFISNPSTFQAIGSSSPILTPQDTYQDVCKSSSAFYFTGQTSAAEKVWPANGEKYAWFKAIPVPEPEQVTCRTTIDNAMTHVRYGGQDLHVTGIKDNFQSVKTFTFTPSPGSVLEIGGYEFGNCNGCECAGFILECDNGFISQKTTFTALGSNSPLIAPGSVYESVCKSSSGFYLTGQTSAAEKLWAANGEKYVWFRAVPIPVRGSYPICYTDGVKDNTRIPTLKQRIKWTDEYWFTVPSCPSGYVYSGGYKGCGWGWCAECYQAYYSCDDYPNHLLVEGRKVPSSSSFPVAYCLDKTKLGNA